jgi:hypothetical protein
MAAPQAALIAAQTGADPPPDGHTNRSPSAVGGTTRISRNVRSMSAVEGNPDIRKSAPKGRSTLAAGAGVFTQPRPGADVPTVRSAGISGDGRTQIATERTT